jgi:hypothetical protein
VTERDQVSGSLRCHNACQFCSREDVSFGNSILIDQGDGRGLKVDFANGGGLAKLNCFRRDINHARRSGRINVSKLF